MAPCNQSIIAFDLHELQLFLAWKLVMYRPQPMHAGAPWSQPQQHQQQHNPYFPNGDYGQPPPQWQQQQQLEHLPPAQFHQEQRQPGVPGVHGRGQGDEMSQRLKEEQRRKQNEYSQALSEQVRQREAQKQHEREARRREDMEGVGNQAIDPATGQPKIERGLFDGLGQTNNNQRGNYGRGRREAPQQQQHHPLQPPALHQSPTQSQLHQIPPMATENQMQQGWSGYSEALGIAEFPQHHQIDPQLGLTPRQDAGPWAPPPTHYQQQPQQAQQVPGGAGRRVRNDLHNAGAGGIVDDAQAKRRQQQQIDMQDSLRRQIEEKQRLKQEEKRKREEEERREMEKFEQEKRRQQEEQDRIKEGKRRKALAEEEHFRAQQMQLEAANAAAAHEKELRHQRDQRNRQSPQKATLNGDLHHGNVPQLPHQPQHPNAAGMQKNPFTNSRAHLFQDPPQAHTGPLSIPASVPVAVHHQPQGFHQTQGHHQQRHDRHVGQQPSHAHAAAFAGAHEYNQPPPPLVDAHVLMEQYEQVRDELQRQRELVEQLHAQIQQQQQQQQHRHQREDPRELPTLSDLERLRQELREELEQRETQHRHELASLRKQNQQQDHRNPFEMTSPPKQAVLREPIHNTEYQKPRPMQPGSRGPQRRHDAFVQDALDEDEDAGEADDRLDRSNSHHALDRHQCGNQASSPVVAARRNAMPQAEPQRSHKLLRSSLSTSSLQCESKLVFFDGRVQPPGTIHPRSHSPELIAEEPEQRDEDDNEEGEEEEGRTREDDSVDDLLQAFRRSFPRDKQRISDDQGSRFSNNQIGRELHRQPQSKPISNTVNKPDDEDSLGFFVKRFEASPAEPARYRVSTDSYPPAMLRYVEVDRPVLQNQDGLIEYGLNDGEDDDDEDEDDGSLNGDKLEAIFQRNVRRHEILSGFEARTHHHNGAPEPMHWQQLQQLLRNVPGEVEKARATGSNSKSVKEESLVASSRWMPSSLLH